VSVELERVAVRPPAAVATTTPAAAARLPSIRRRLARSLWLGSLVCTLAIAVAVGLAAQEEVDEMLDDTLRASAEVMGALLPAGGQPPPVVFAAGNGESRFAWQVVDASQRVVSRSARAPSEPLARAAGFSDAPQWRVFGLALGGDGRMLYVAQTRGERVEAQFEVATSSVLAALAVGLLGYFWLSSRLKHEWAPVQRLSERLATHEPLTAGATMGVAERAELHSVHRAVDRLGQRLAQRLARERAFSAHAAHALRTPLAGIDAQLALCLRDSPPTLRPRLQRAREAAARLQRVVAALLTLFRSDGEPVREAVDLDQLVHQSPLERLQVRVQATQPIEADPDLLAAALANLLDNAQRHGATAVTVSTPAPHTVRLDDDGPGVAAERAQALRAALDAQTYDGVLGLGLTLADLVARAHGGRLQLPTPHGTRGFAVELGLQTPRAA
jgi:signal transduction histidine kinase